MTKYIAHNGEEWKPCDIVNGCKRVKADLKYGLVLPLLIIFPKGIKSTYQMLPALLYSMQDQS